MCTQGHAGRISPFPPGRSSGRLCLHEKLDGEALNILVRSGLQKWSHNQRRQQQHESSAVRNAAASSSRVTAVNARLQTGLPMLRRSLPGAALDAVLRPYPWVVARLARPRTHPSGNGLDALTGGGGLSCRRKGKGQASG